MATVDPEIICKQHLFSEIPIEHIVNIVFDYILLRTLCAQCKEFYHEPIGCILHTKKLTDKVDMNNRMFFDCLDHAIGANILNLVCNDWLDTKIWAQVVKHIKSQS